MNHKSSETIYSTHHTNFIDKILVKKRFEMIEVINQFLNKKDLNDVLDVGTTSDDQNPSSNILIKNLKNFKTYNSISDQKITSNFFNKILQKSITDDFTDDEIKQYSSDLVISNATIEHVGNYENQKKMIENIIKFSNKFFIIITPNRFHPLEFHTKIPFFHWLPKKIHRKLLSLLNFEALAKEENLNLMSKKEINLILKKFTNITYELKGIKFLLFKSNFIIIGKKTS
jgi:hypothetical protein